MQTSEDAVAGASARMVQEWDRIGLSADTRGQVEMFAAMNLRRYKRAGFAMPEPPAPDGPAWFRDSFPPGSTRFLRSVVAMQCTMYAALARQRTGDANHQDVTELAQYFAAANVPPQDRDHPAVQEAHALHGARKKVALYSVASVPRYQKKMAQAPCLHGANVADEERFRRKL